MDTANILLVDDDKSTRVVLTALLEDSAYTVRACGTAEEALGHLMSQDPVDVVVSDLRLPDGSGLQVLWALKKINPNAAFILITGYDPGNGHRSGERRGLRLSRQAAGYGCPHRKHPQRLAAQGPSSQSNWF